DCGFDESKIITKIMDIVQRRGKLHNPFTGSGGLLYGTIEAMGTLYQKKSPYQEGDEILCLATLTGIPLSMKSTTAMGRFWLMGMEYYPWNHRLPLFVHPSSLATPWQP
ncbi:MAG: hypothetical protein RR661_05785, partial [Anaerovoracaceae bacterium]